MQRTLQAAAPPCAFVPGHPLFTVAFTHAAFAGNPAERVLLMGHAVTTVKGELAD